jgi:hypothetical protein
MRQRQEVRVRESGHLKLNESEGRTISGSEGRDSPDYDGAASDQSDFYADLRGVEEAPDTRVSDVDVQSRGSGTIEAANNIQFNVMEVTRELPVREPNPSPKTHPIDPRSLQKSSVTAIVHKVTGLSSLQRNELHKILIKYLDHMTAKPGRCILFEYKFQVNTDEPIVGYSRPVPFALRPAVRQHINQMLREGIIEKSASPILNPLALVKKEGGNIRICIDAFLIDSTVQQFRCVCHMM